MIPLMKHAFFNEFETKKQLSEFILRADRLSMDTQCFEFEKQFARFQNSRFARLFNSGGSANLAILQALKNLGRLKDGDNVGFSALTWSTNVFPIIQMGLNPVPIDCNLDTLNVMVKDLETVHEQKKLRAFFATNVLGLAGDLDKIQTFCSGSDIIFLEDNCESLGTELCGKKTGTFGHSASFSFFVAHHMSTIEGGMVCTNDEEMANMLTLVRANGWDRNLDTKRQLELRRKYNIESEFEAKYTFYDLGFNMRPTEITGFLGIKQLAYLPQNIEAREKNHHILKAIAGANQDFYPLADSHLEKISGFAYPVICKSSDMRDKYIKRFSGAGVEIRPVIAGNMQRQPFFRKYVSEKYELPNANIVHGNGFYFGNYPELTESDLEILKGCLTKY
ncbi:MAG: DegT/DnrJ/EryC1/StrS family aminotransferase [Turneriella sp.]|nr:DegT/DnrJ/EryC1/StrS family aminotransferase [Turneriella sp.]